MMKPVWGFSVLYIPMTIVIRISWKLLPKYKNLIKRNLNLYFALDTKVNSQFSRVEYKKANLKNTRRKHGCWVWGKPSQTVPANPFSC